MPTYEYECRQCGHRFEKFQSMKDQPLQKCEKCGGELRRLIGTGAGILFKGSGFYQTDYRSDSYRKKAKSETGDSSPKKEGGSETKKKEPKSGGEGA
ncbi:MAG TPA: FmdB family zinc ribbon protein [Candidatus Eisenbacteria bacterium]|nr:FmdB family zinc ribbon protein [Candidatus Eisenbacteria bacterium]